MRASAVPALPEDDAGAEAAQDHRRVQEVPQNGQDHRVIDDLEKAGSSVGRFMTTSDVPLRLTQSGLPAVSAQRFKASLRASISSCLSTAGISVKPYSSISVQLARMVS